MQFLTEIGIIDEKISVDLSSDRFSTEIPLVKFSREFTNGSYGKILLVINNNFHW